MADLYSKDGEVVGSVDLDPSVFDIEPNTAVLHQVVVAQLAAARSGTANTKTRAERRGGGAKPWRQKGTGRARQGSIRSPQWVGGGVVHGPAPRDYSQRTPKKMLRLATRSALSDRARTERLRVLDGFGWDEPKTKVAKAVLGALSLEGRVLVVVDSWDDTNTVRSFRNLPAAHVISASQVNAYDVLRSDWVLLSRDALDAVTGRLSTGSAAATEAPEDTPADAGVTA